MKGSQSGEASAFLWGKSPVMRWRATQLDFKLDLFTEAISKAMKMESLGWVPEQNSTLSTVKLRKIILK